MKVLGFTITRTKRSEYGEHLCSQCGKSSQLPGTIVGCAAHEGYYEGWTNGRYTGMTPQQRINNKNKVAHEIAHKTASRPTRRGARHA